jgi:putative transposase
MPSIPSDEAIVRLVGAFAIVLEPMAQNGSLQETNDEWAVARRCMSLETLARVTDHPTVRLPAVAA